MRFTNLAIGTLLVCGALAAALLPDVASRGFALPDATLFTVALFTFVIGAALLAYRDVYAFAWLLVSLGACLARRASRSRWRWTRPSRVKSPAS